MKQLFYYSDAVKRQLKLVVVLSSLANLSLWPVLIILRRINAQIIPVYLLCGVMVLLLTMIMVFTFINLKKKTFIEVNEEEIRLRPSFILSLTERVARWEELEGFEIGETTIRGKGLFNDPRVVQLIFKDPKPRQTFIIALYSVDQPDEFLSLLQEQIPNLTERKHQAFLRETEGMGEIRYGPWRLTAEGLHQNFEMVPWDRILTIRTRGKVLAGYGGVRVCFRSENGPEREWVIAPKNNQTYRSFVSRLVHSSSSADVSREVITMMIPTPKESRAQLGFVFLGLFAVAYIYFLIPILKGYAMNLAAFIAMVAGLLSCLVLMSVSVHMRYRQQKPSMVRATKLMAVGNFMLIIGTALMFALSPSAFQLFKGDAWMAAERPEKARICYGTVLNKYPEHLEILYKNARAAYAMEDYEACFNLMKKAYIKDSKNWRAESISLLPESLIQLGRDEEARLWCRRIMEDHRRSNEVQRKMGEILRRMEE